MQPLARLRRPEGPADAVELMPDWLIARLVAVYAAAYAGLVAYGGQTLCDARRAGFGSDNLWCSVFVRDEQWIVLIVAPAAVAMLVVLALPRGHDRRFRAWLLLALTVLLFVCVGPAL